MMIPEVVHIPIWTQWVAEDLDYSIEPAFPSFCVPFLVSLHRPHFLYGFVERVLPLHLEPVFPVVPLVKQAVQSPEMVSSSEDHEE